ncbi:pentatricopeptide repeat-containing protein At2g27610-like [Mangifera indica]|uniref:pentatricopeptide repeat-containing protein At2g27610-like n=1 Tax=Mangifera indica TaxID=29780 RepID=UPI001CFA3166|nr:pentatricopeptide repeat-containing protein At2g27610-like [Mangifera indica]
MSLSRLLRHLGDTKCIPKGRALHANIITSGFHPDVYANNHLLLMYIKFNRIEDAQKMFDRMPERNVISWSALISSFSQKHMPNTALLYFRLMVFHGFEPNYYTYVGAVSACASISDGRTGKEIHGKLYRSGLELNSHVSNCLINMYGKCGLLRSAQFVFDATLEPNLVSWTSLLSSYCQHGEHVHSLNLFVLSRKAGVVFNEFSGASVLGACAALGNLKVGIQVHSLVLKCCLEFDKFIVTGLINLYSKCGELEMACRVFLGLEQPDLSAWSTLIGGYVQFGKAGEAIDLFVKLYSSGLAPSERTFSCVLGAFADTKDVEAGKQLHSLIIKTGCSSFTFVNNAVLDFYSKCGLLEESMKTFEEMDEHDIVSWNALISGHVGLGHYEEAIEHLKNMLSDGHYPNLYTYSSILNICSDVPAIGWGKQTHCCIIKPGFVSNVVVGTALVDMYAKCGKLLDARKVFDFLNSKNLVSWNTMLVGYAQHGLGREALEIYSLMQRNKIKPNDITFIGVLSACGNMGLLEEGWHHFNSMITDHFIAPRMDHMAVMVSLFARSGQTGRAYEFIKSFPVEPDKVVWRCLLSGCKTHKDVVLGRYAAEKILSIDPEDAAALIMLSNVYAEAKMWDETAQVRKIMKEKALKKDTGYSWTELKNKIHYFSASHYAQFQGINLCEIMHGLTAHLFDAGYEPDAIFSLHFE